MGGGGGPMRGGAPRLQRTLDAMQPYSTAALLATIVLLFAFQGRQILAQPLVIAMLAVPIVIQVYLNAGVAYWLNRRLRVAHSVAGPSALIGASNFFELAVAAAITLFGFDSGAALATVVGVLVEVPVMLSVVSIVNATRAWYEEGAATMRSRLDYVKERLRLLYVGITRAKRDLIVTWNSGRQGDATPSLALSELMGWWEGSVQ